MRLRESCVVELRRIVSQSVKNDLFQIYKVIKNFRYDIENLHECIKLSHRSKINIVMQLHFTGITFVTK